MSEDTDIDNDFDSSDDSQDVVDVVGDAVEDASVVARESIRKQLQSDVEAFLASGGQIKEIAPNVVTDPPRKPQSNYGGQPI